jgi:hypothetical protein
MLYHEYYSKPLTYTYVTGMLLSVSVLAFLSQDRARRSKVVARMLYCCRQQRPDVRPPGEGEPQRSTTSLFFDFRPRRQPHVHLFSSVYVCVLRLGRGDLMTAVIGSCSGWCRASL